MRSLPLTTATTHDPRSPAGKRRLPVVLALLYGALFAALAVHPLDRGNWLIESALPLSLVAMLAGMYRRWHLSDASYLCVAAFLALHAVGAHYSYAHVPLGEWARELLASAGGGARNPYDRIVHFAFGLLLVYPLREALLYHVPSRRTAALFAVAAVLALGAVYEVLEWGVAHAVAPHAAARFVGTQGDPWDAQQDVALAWAGGALGAMVIAALGRLAHRADRHPVQPGALVAPPPPRRSHNAPAPPLVH